MSIISQQQVFNMLFWKDIRNILYMKTFIGLQSEHNIVSNLIINWGFVSITANNGGGKYTLATFAKTFNDIPLIAVSRTAGGMFFYSEYAVSSRTITNLNIYDWSENHNVGSYSVYYIAIGY